MIVFPKKRGGGLFKICSAYGQNAVREGRLFDSRCFILSSCDGKGLAAGNQAIKNLPFQGGFLMAGATGLEPATYGVTGRHSNQTELRPRDKDTYIDLRT